MGSNKYDNKTACFIIVSGWNGSVLQIKFTAEICIDAIKSVLLESSLHAHKNQYERTEAKVANTHKYIKQQNALVSCP